MLVLTRRIGEEIILDQGLIQIKILHVRHGVVAVGIQAPSQMDVDRKEVFLKKKFDQQQDVK